jgi:hypothetical protein
MSNFSYQISHSTLNLGKPVLQGFPLALRGTTDEKHCSVRLYSDSVRHKTTVKCQYLNAISKNFRVMLEKRILLLIRRKEKSIFEFQNLNFAYFPF